MSSTFLFRIIGKSRESRGVAPRSSGKQAISRLLKVRSLPSSLLTRFASMPWIQSRTLLQVPIITRFSRGQPALYAGSLPEEAGAVRSRHQLGHQARGAMLEFRARIFPLCSERYLPREMVLRRRGIPASHRTGQHTPE